MMKLNALKSGKRRGVLSLKPALQLIIINSYIFWTELKMKVTQKDLLLLDLIYPCLPSRKCSPEREYSN